MGKRGHKPKFVDVACPNDKCNRFGVKGQGNIIENGTYPTKSGRIRKYICTSCRTIFCERTNTVFYASHERGYGTLGFENASQRHEPSIHSPDFRAQPKYDPKVAFPSSKSK